uniref:Uncharacterized protein n=1 Tax=Euplotes harpa TaxID=151035 RepID=A0A7S3J2H1_9SPIT|mmetsp:Transcript_11278/g.12745  ORF Transcript_11278/g.12745 Transcript_11278/m.12745 type:complete len:115 (+) Transcript_11278:364-708(+)
MLMPVSFDELCALKTKPMMLSISQGTNVITLRIHAHFDKLLIANLPSCCSLFWLIKLPALFALIHLFKMIPAMSDRGTDTSKISSNERTISRPEDFKIKLRMKKKIEIRRTAMS